MPQDVDKSAVFPIAVGGEMARESMLLVINMLRDQFPELEIKPHDVSDTVRLMKGAGAIGAFMADVNAHGSGSKHATKTNTALQRDALIDGMRQLNELGLLEKLVPGVDLGTLEEQIEANYNFIGKTPNKQVRTSIGAGHAVAQRGTADTGLPTQQPEQQDYFNVHVVTMDHGGKETGEVQIAEEDGQVFAHSGKALDPVAKGSPVMLGTVEIEDVLKKMRACMAGCLVNGNNLRLVQKETVVKGYDGNILNSMQEELDRTIPEKFCEKIGIAPGTTWREAFAEKNLKVDSALIDAAALQLMTNPNPGKWETPEVGQVYFAFDAYQGQYLKAAVDAIRKHGIATADDIASVQFTRLVSGEGPYVGQQGIGEDGQPFTLMAADKEAVHAWVRETVAVAQENGHDRAVFTLNDGNAYDNRIREIIDAYVASPEFKAELGANAPEVAFMSHAEMAVELFSNENPDKYPMTVAVLNLEGDILTDMSYVRGPSVGLSGIRGQDENGQPIVLCETPHGTAHDLHMSRMEAALRLAAEEGLLEKMAQDDKLSPELRKLSGAIVEVMGDQMGTLSNEAPQGERSHWQASQKTSDQELYKLLNRVDVQLLVFGHHLDKENEIPGLIDALKDKEFLKRHDVDAARAQEATAYPAYGPGAQIMSVSAGIGYLAERHELAETKQKAADMRQALHDVWKEGVLTYDLYRNLPPEGKASGQYQSVSTPEFIDAVKTRMLEIAQDRGRDEPPEQLPSGTEAGIRKDGQQRAA